MNLGSHRRALVLAGTALVAVASAAVVALAVSRDSAWLVLAGVLGLLVSVGLVAGIASRWAVARSEARLRRRIGEVEAAVHETRAKASRHEYHQERSLARIEQVSREVAATTAGLAWFRPREAPIPADGTPPRVLFVTSNGGGMGHIARCAAVLRHSQGLLTGRILTLSTAASTVAAAGYDVEYFPSQRATARGLDHWRRQFTRKLLQELSENPADAIVFDGTWVFSSLTDVAEIADLPLIWLRRGLWREGTDLSQVTDWREHVTSVVTPRDIAEDESTAPEIFREAVWTAPVSLAPSTPMPRAKAIAALGLDPERRYALVQLSGGNGDGSATAAVVDGIRRTSDLVPVVVRSPLLPESARYDTVTIAAQFPLVDFAAAWDFTVTGAGYNSVHENLHTGTPGVYLPSATTLNDDQGRRARAVAEAQLGLVADGVDDAARAVAEMAAGRRAEEVRAAIRERRVAQGASSVARAIVTSRPLSPH
ncbi:hypothetical protein [Puerhibacterium puerhi]|uniref:hypothetical protein n=1 Tax=Puerhibacterium puerhi TaxID=2692623 RepID=UPI00135B51E5|nr:hypothetical protein [Puerhibacterium puerhi]